MAAKTMMLLAALLLIGSVLTVGCKDNSQSTPAVDAPAVPSADAAAVTIEQTTCPVMGGPINKDLYTEYKGKKVYFCCAGCKEQFEKDPDKYLSKLPQFKQ